MPKLMEDRQEEWVNSSFRFSQAMETVVIDFFVKLWSYLDAQQHIFRYLPVDEEARGRSSLEC